MRSITLSFRTPDVSADEAYRRLVDYPAYPALTEAVRAVTVDDPAEDGSVLSRWTVQFRSGLLQWTERDVFDPVARTIDFVQVTGDFHVFDGRWAAAQGPDGTTLVTFEATFDLGMATLEAILEPIAESALRDNIRLIVEGLLGRAEHLDRAAVPEGSHR